jgi:hypothetical protein
MSVNNNQASESNVFVGAPLGAIDLAGCIAPKGAPTQGVYL